MECSKKQLERRLRDRIIEECDLEEYEQLLGSDFDSDEGEYVNEIWMRLYFTFKWSFFYS